MRFRFIFALFILLMMFKTSDVYSKDSDGLKTDYIKALEWSEGAHQDIIGVMEDCAELKHEHGIGKRCFVENRSDLIRIFNFSDKLKDVYEMNLFRKLLSSNKETNNIHDEKEGMLYYLGFVKTTSKYCIECHVSTKQTHKYGALGVIFIKSSISRQINTTFK